MTRSRRRSSGRRPSAAWLGAGAATLVAAGVAAVLLVTGGERTVDPVSAADRVARAVEESFGVRPDVACPDGVDAERGERFVCTARASGERLRITVELLDDQGRFRIASLRAG